MKVCSSGSSESTFRGGQEALRGGESSSLLSLHLIEAELSPSQVKTLLFLPASMNPQSCCSLEIWSVSKGVVLGFVPALEHRFLAQGCHNSATSTSPTHPPHGGC